MRMFSVARIVAVLATTLAFGMPAYAENTYTSEKFLKLPEASQVFYIQATVGALASVSAFNNDAQAKCISNWFFKREKEATRILLDAMQKHSNFHPRSLIIAVLQKQCGSFDYKPRRA